MTLDELLSRLDGVRPRGGGRYSARCPAHGDSSPSLSIAAGERGILVRCWAGCTVEQICSALGLRIADLYHDARPDPHALAEARRRREQARQQAVRDGLAIDARREAERLIRTARGIDISEWTDGQLDAALNRLAAAHAVLSKEADYYDRRL